MIVTGAHRNGAVHTTWLRVASELGAASVPAVAVHVNVSGWPSRSLAIAANASVVVGAALALGAICGVSALVRPNFVVFVIPVALLAAVPRGAVPRWRTASLVALPAVALIGVADVLFLGLGLQHSYSASDRNLWIALWLAGLVMFVLDLAALALLAMWMSLKNRKPTQAGLIAIVREIGRAHV